MTTQWWKVFLGRSRTNWCIAGVTTIASRLKAASLNGLNAGITAGGGIRRWAISAPNRSRLESIRIAPTGRGEGHLGTKRYWGLFVIFFLIGLGIHFVLPRN